MNKKTILIDLDGVLNNYKGNFNNEFIPEIKDGAKNFLKKLSMNYTIKLFTTRNKILASKWLIENGVDKYISDITNIKEAYNTNPDILVYSGVPAQKFLANKEPEKDFEVIKGAINNIVNINPKKVILISEYHHLLKMIFVD